MNNYFELYNIPLNFSPDQSAVKKKFYELSRIYHPDRFTMATQNEQNEALRISALNNEAYKILKNADKTIEYVLKLSGALSDETKHQLPPDFLMEMMDVNETVSEYEFEPENIQLKQKAHSTLQELLEGLNKQMAPLLNSYDATKQNTGQLNQIKDLYFRKKYILRIQDRIGNIN